MGKGDNKPRGRMSAYAFFVQTCREEHKKKHPDESVVFAEFSRRCADRWKVCTFCISMYLNGVYFMYTKKFYFFLAVRLCLKKKRPDFIRWPRKTKNGTILKWQTTNHLIKPKERVQKLERGRELKTQMHQKDHCKSLPF